MILVSLMLSFQSIKAQTELLTKGQKLNKFDSAVAIEINSYRKVTQSLKKRDSLDYSRRVTIEKLEAKTGLLEQKINNYENTINLLNSEIQRKQELNKQLQEKFINLLEENENKPFFRKIFESDGFWFGLGGATVLLIVSVSSS